jgi:hypothetical protein
MSKQKHGAVVDMPSRSGELNDMDRLLAQSFLLKLQNAQLQITLWDRQKREIEQALTGEQTDLLQRFASKLMPPSDWLWNWETLTFEAPKPKPSV